MEELLATNVFSPSLGFNKDFNEALLKYFWQKTPVIVLQICQCVILKGQVVRIYK